MKNKRGGLLLLMLTIVLFSLQMVFLGNPIVIATQDHLLRQKLWTKRSRTLVACTTLNHWKTTFELIKSVGLVRDSFDFVLFDDASNDGTPQNAKAYGIPVIENPGMQGVTYTWNRAYRCFKVMGYEYLFIINNDVLLPDGAIDAMVRDLEEIPAIQVLGPLTTVKGMGLSIGGRKLQTIEHHRPDLTDFVKKLPALVAVQAVQDSISVFADFSGVKENQPNVTTNSSSGVDISNRVSYMRNGVLGFFLGFRRSSAEEFEFSRDVMFNPDRVMLGQEQDLFNPPRSIRSYVSKRAFVYHAKGTTVKVNDCLLQDLVNRDPNSARGELLAAYHGLTRNGNVLDCPEDDDNAAVVAAAAAKRRSA